MQEHGTRQHQSANGMAAADESTPRINVGATAWEARATSASPGCNAQSQMNEPIGLSGFMKKTRPGPSVCQFDVSNSDLTFWMAWVVRPRRLGHEVARAGECVKEFALRVSICLLLLCLSPHLSSPQPFTIWRAGSRTPHRPYAVQATGMLRTTPPKKDQVAFFCGDEIAIASVGSIITHVTDCVLGIGVNRMGHSARTPQGTHGSGLGRGHDVSKRDGLRRVGEQIGSLTG